jgi:hypothetical protein
MDARVFVLALLLATPAPQATPSAAPPASPSPAGPTDPALEELIAKLPAGDPAAVFGALEDFVNGEDGPAEKAAQRARLVLARFAAIQAALPPPPEKHAGELAQLLFTAAKALEEAGAAKDALPVYERILAEFPKAVWEGGVSQEPIANQASERLRWHREKHPWIMSGLDALLTRLRAAFTGRRADELAALIARIGFWSGPFSSEGGADDPDRVLKLLDSVWPKGGVTVATDVEPFSDRNRQVFLKVSGFTGEFADAYAIVERVPEGWQWIGVAFAAKPGADPAADAEPVAMPSAAASPSPSPSAK